MEGPSTRTRWTYAEFARLPSEGGTRHEIAGGELVVTPAPGLRHQRIVTGLVTLLHAFVRANDLGELLAGPFDVLLAEGDYLEPDIVFVAKARLHLLSERGAEGPPDLVVEVASLATAHRDRNVKLERYRHFGVTEYWIVDPEARTVEAWRFDAEGVEPRTLGPGERLRWAPAGGSAVLDVDVGEVLGTG